MISLLLHESEVKPRTSVDIIRMHLGYNWLISQKTVSINASFVKQQTMASGYVYFLCIINSIDDIFLPFFSWVISTYRPRRISRYHPACG